MSTENKKTWKTLGIIGLVVGILALIMSLFGALGLYLGVVGIVLCVASLVLASKQQGKYVAAAIGLVLSLAGSYFGYNMMKTYEAVATELTDKLKDIKIEDLNVEELNIDEVEVEEAPVEEAPAEEEAH